ncbi:transposase [Rhodococcus sp. LB1]|uniref:transposase n=1 Tax=Rhodococcus sp. LB1 TaxID=1807499 RepID=UPI000B03F179
MDRYQVLTDKQWELLALLLPSSDGLRGRKFQNSRLVVEGMLYRLRTGRRCGNGTDATPGMERGIGYS